MGAVMSVISMAPAVITNDLALARVQQRFEVPLTQLLLTPWGNGVLVQGLALTSAAGNQTLTVFHGMGRAVNGALIGNCTVPVYGPWNVRTVDNNRCVLTLNLPSGVAAGMVGTLVVWVY